MKSPDLRSVAGILWAAATLLGPTQDSGTELADDQVRWMPSYTAALEVAQREKKPLLVCFDMDGEQVCDDTVFGIYRSPAFVAMTRDFVCVYGSQNEHALVDAADGSGKKVCSRVGVVSCAEHKVAETQAWNRLVGSPERIAPQHILVSPEGELLERRAYYINRSALMGLMKSALIRSGTAAGLATEQEQIAALLKAADEERLSIRKRQHLEQIAKLGTPTARDTLIGYLQDGDDEMARATVARLLGRSGDYMVLLPLQEATRDASPHVALAAVESLEVLHLPGAVSYLKNLLRTFPKGHDHGRVLRAYAACGPEDDKVVNLLHTKAKSASDVAARAHALTALHYFEPTSKTEQVLKSALKTDDSLVRAAAIYTIGERHLVDFEDDVAVLQVDADNLVVQSLARQALEHLPHQTGAGEEMDCDCDLWTPMRGLLAQDEAASRR